MSIFVTKDGLKEHHKLSKKKSLKEFTDCPRMKVAEMEELWLTNLNHEIETKYPSYLDRTIGMKIANWTGINSIQNLLTILIVAAVAVVALTGEPVYVLLKVIVAIYSFISSRLRQQLN